jgi:hypothetical protein
VFSGVLTNFREAFNEFLRCGNRFMSPPGVFHDELANFRDAFNGFYGTETRFFLAHNANGSERGVVPLAVELG